MTGLHAEKLHHSRRLRRSGTAEREKREGARIDAALDGHLANGVGLIPVGNLDDALGELLDAHAAGKPRRQRSETGTGTRGIEAMPPPISAGGMRPSTRLASVMVGSIPPFG